MTIFQSFGRYSGFVFGLACGSILLTWLYNGTGGSILACAIWHGGAERRPPALGT